MMPQAYVCCKCRQEGVWTDCLPAICYACREKENPKPKPREREEELPRPAHVVTETLDGLTRDEWIRYMEYLKSQAWVVTDRGDR